MGLIAIDGVFRQGALAPCVGTSHSMNVQVDVEIDKLATFLLIRVLDIKVFLTIVPRTNAERLTYVDTQCAVI